MRLRGKNILRLVYRLWITFTVISFDFVKSLQNSKGSDNDFIHSISSTKSISYSIKTPLKSSRIAQLTDLPALNKHLTSSLISVVNKTEEVIHNNKFSLQNLGGFKNLTDEESISHSTKLVPNSLKNKSFSKWNIENKVNARIKRHVEESDVEQKVRAIRRGHAWENASLMGNIKVNPKNHQESIVLQSLLSTASPEVSHHESTHITPFTKVSANHVFRTNTTCARNKSDTSEEHSASQEKNGKVNSRHPLQNKELLHHCNDGQPTSSPNSVKKGKEVVDKIPTILSSVELVHTQKELVDQNETKEQAPLHGENEDDENHTQVVSHETVRKVGNVNLASQNFHVFTTHTTYSRLSFNLEEHFSENAITDEFTTTRPEKADIEFEVPESEFSEFAEHKKSETTPSTSKKGTTVRSYIEKRQRSITQEIMSSTITHDTTPFDESLDVVSDAINNSTQWNLQTQMPSGEQDNLIERFKLKYPVKLWKSLGLLQDKYLKNINSHWMKFEPPNTIVHKIFAALYGIFMVVGCGANFVVIFMFSRCRSLRTPPNYLILNLAISDFFMMAKTPIYIVNSLYYGPVLGQIGCSIYGFVGGLTGTASIMTLASIAVDRYYAIVHPLNPFKRTTSQRVSFMILFSWLYAALFSSLPLFGVNNYTSEGYLTSCSFDYLSENMQHRMFVFIFFLAAWLFPLTVIVFSYANIFRIVRAAERMEIFSTNVRQPVGESFKCKPNLGSRHKSEVKIAFLAGALISLWLVAWTPYALVALVGIFGGKEFLTPLISSIPSLFCKTASCINPFVYILNHPKFQRELRSHFPICFRYHQKEQKGSRNNSCCSGVTYRANENLAEDADQPNLKTRRSLNLAKATEANVEMGLVKYSLKPSHNQMTYGETRNSNSIQSGCFQESD